MPEPAAAAPVVPPPAVAPAPEHTSADRTARYAAVQQRLEVLGTGVMDYWKQHGLDAEFGGIHATLNRQGQPVAPTDKALIQQARHLWTFSTWFARREATPQIRAVADNVYRFLLEHFRDRDGEFFYKVSRDGKPVERKKQLYAESFAVFALATYGRVFDVVEARQHALECFRSIDRRTHDQEHLGYDQSDDPGWLAQGAQKGTNTHIHLLEAFTELLRATGDPTVRARLEEMVRVTTTKIAQPADYAHKEFYRDWRPHAEPVVSYGHDLETAWLLIDALDALGHPDDHQVRAVAQRLGAHSATVGYDERLGGFFEEGPVGQPPNKLEKIWWVQAEALAGLWWLHRLTGEERYFEQLEGTLGWIEQHQRDAQYGEWFWGITPEGKLGPRGDNKGEEWKTNYHATRAVVFTSDWIAAALEP